MIVDTHVYPLASDLKKYPLAPVGAQAEWSKGVHLTADEILGLMNDAGIDRAHLVQALTVHGYDNNFCADVCASHPGKFVGICGLDAWAPDGVDRLNYWVQERGLRGVRIYAVDAEGKANLKIDDPRTFGVWERAGQLGVPLEIGLVGSLGMVSSMLERFPGTKVLFHHMGLASRLISLDEGPPYEEAQGLFDLVRYPNLYLQATSRLVRQTSIGKSTPTSFFERVVEVFGATRLVWGSTYPGANASYKDVVAEAHDAFKGLTTSDRDAILGKTALHLYGDGA